MPDSSRFPKEVKGNLVWNPGEEFRDGFVQRVLGTVQSWLARNVETKATCRINLSKVTWGDPQALLFLGCVLRQSTFDRTRITLDLGEPLGPHAIFLKFLAQQDFIKAFMENATVELSGETIPQDKETRNERITNLADSLANLHHPNSECIRAKFVNLRDRVYEGQGLQDFVENLIVEASEVNGVAEHFADNLEVKDELLQKLRKFLYEPLLNIKEHAYPDGKPAIAGLFARVHGARPQNQSSGESVQGTGIADDLAGQAEPAPSPSKPTRQEKWDDVEQRIAKDVPPYKDFKPAKYVPWLEVYICDIGLGIVHHIEDWKVWHGNNDDFFALPKERQDEIEGLHSIFKKVASYRDGSKLEAIASLIFKEPFSCKSREAIGFMTGLKHLGQLLDLGKDYSRLYSDRGVNIGSHMPWKVRQADRSSKQTEYKNFTSITGTGWIYYLQPKEHSQALTDFDAPSDEGLSEIARYLKKEAAAQENEDPDPFAELDRLILHDHRTQKSALPPSQVLENGYSKVEDLAVAFRPPRLLAKSDLFTWLAAVGEHRNITQFVIVELSRFQALYLSEILRFETLDKKSVRSVVLVTEDYHIQVLKRNIGKMCFELDKVGVQEFLNAETETGLARITDLLRKKDSEIFWQGLDANALGNDEEPFFHPGAVDWKGKRDLKGYLDLTHALVDRSRYRACRRALRRSLALYPGHKVVPSDDLVPPILGDIQRRQGGGTAHSDDNAQVVVVGSIGVTQETNRDANQSGNAPEINLFSRQAATEEQKILNALYWQEPKKLNKPISVDGWKRIPGTAYVAEHGEYSISIVRYPVKENGDLDFSRPYYALSPEKTYAEFQRLRILKMGHWEYGNRHDLMTLNIDLALRASFLDQGPLADWLETELVKHFSENQPSNYVGQDWSPASFILYSSHATTDLMVRWIQKRLENPEGRLAKVGLTKDMLVPVKFLGAHSVSPALVSSLVRERVKKLTSVQTNWTALILDDANISGKNLRELTQFLQGMGAKQPRSLMLVDRSGLPAEPGENIFGRYSGRHSRRWRWDVPTLGYKRDCLLCRALDQASILLSETTMPSHQRRLEYWRDIWGSRNVSTHWHRTDVNAIPTPFDQQMPITFGASPKSTSQDPRAQLIQAGNSTVAASVIAELSRLTTRHDVAAKKFYQNFGGNPAVREALPKRQEQLDATMEVVSAQLLLFQDEFRAKDRCGYATILLKSLLEQSGESDATALAALTLATLDEDTLQAVIKSITEAVKDAEQLGIDALLTIRLLDARFSKSSGYEKPENGQLSELLSDSNKVLLGYGDPEAVLKSYVNWAYEDCNSEPRLHTGELAKNLSMLDDNDQAPVVVRDTIQRLVCVSDGLLGLGDCLLIPAEWAREKAFELNALITELRTNSSASSEMLGPIGEKIKTFFEDEENGIHKNLRALLWKRLWSVDGEKRFFHDVVTELQRNWADFIRDRFKTGRVFSKIWMKDLIGEEIADLEVEVLTDDQQNLRDIFIFCDGLVQELIEESIKNVCHAEGKMHCPWDINNSPKREVHMWCRVALNDQAREVTVTLKNRAVKNQHTEPKFRRTRSGLERIGGKYSVSRPIEEDHGSGIYIVTTEIRIPTYRYFLEGKAHAD